MGIGVLDGHDDPGDAGGDHGVGARRRPPVWAHGSRVVKRVAPAACVAGRGQGDDLGMAPAGRPGGPLEHRAHRPPITHPTHGFGDVDVRTPAASLIARSMATSSPTAVTTGGPPTGSRVLRGAVGEEVEGVGEDVEDGLQGLDRAGGRAGGVEDEGGADGAGRGPGQAALVGVGRPMASARPGAGGGGRAAVPSGVRSRGPKPVPPVVTTSPANRR